MITPEPDTFVTINPAVAHNHFNVVVMKRDRDEYVVFRCSPAMSRVKAETIARNWAVALGVEIR